MIVLTRAFFIVNYARRETQRPSPCAETKRSAAS